MIKSIAKITLKQETTKSFYSKIIKRTSFLIATLFSLPLHKLFLKFFNAITPFSRDILIYPLCLLFSFPFKNAWTNHGCERKEKCSFKKPRKFENTLKNITKNFDSHDVSLVDRLPGLKYSREDIIKKVKLINEELLTLLEPKEYEVEYEKILKREDISFQVIARVERCLKQSTVEYSFTFSPQPATPPTSVEEISCKLAKLVISPIW